MNSPVFAREKAYDLVIHNALIYDGENLRPFRGDVAISDDQIIAVGDVELDLAEKIMDASDFILAPGFIDAHTHSDFNPLVYPGNPNKLYQGVTTEIVGNCGMSAFPLKEDRQDRIRDAWAREGVEAPEKMPWTGFASYADQLKTAGMMNHMAALLGHGALRFAVMENPNQEANAEELEAMKKFLSQALEEGAIGLSFGLVYVPGIYAKPQEIVELCRVVKQYDGVCSFHIRSESSRLVEAVQEALSIGELTGVKLQISHLKAGGQKNWEKIDQVFDLIRTARKSGVRVFADAYPYTAGYAELGVQLPDPLYEMQGRDAYFQNPENHFSLIKSVREYYGADNPRWQSVVVASIPQGKWHEFEGETIQQIADSVKKSSEEVLVEILADNSFKVSAFSFSQSPDVLKKVLAEPYVMIGSDSIADGSTYPHPRAYGSFEKFLKEFVAQSNWGDAIRRMTGEPARHFGVDRRGRIAAGYIADMILLNPAKINSRADYQNPKLFAEGVEIVFLGGREVLSQGKPTGEKAGNFLKRSTALPKSQAVPYEVSPRV